MSLGIGSLFLTFFYPIIFSLHAAISYFLSLERTTGHPEKTTPVYHTLFPVCVMSEMTFLCQSAIVLSQTMWASRDLTLTCWFILIVGFLTRDLFHM